MVQQANKVFPIEIKSGKDYKTHSALNDALAVKDWQLEQGIVFCMGNLEQVGKITYLPWYMVMFFKQTTLSGLNVELKIDI